MELKNRLTRRTFIKGTIGAGVALSSVNLLSGCAGYDAKGLPTAMLGSTGVRIPRMALGLGSRFCNIDKEDEALEMLSYALDNGLYYWDTAHTYVNTKNGVISEERLGKIVKERRDEIFLSTKISARNPDQAMKEIEGSLKRLQTDHLDILKIHSIESQEDIDEMSQKGHLIDILQKMKDEGVARFIGFSGHGNAGAMTAMAQRGDFDSMLIAMNHWNRKANPQQRQEQAIPKALEKGMGVMLMKAVRPRETVKELKTTDLIKFALSVPGPNGVVVGVDSLEVVKSNLEILRNFTPMDNEQLEKFAMALDPFFKGNNLPWMNRSYCDGHWG
ncbi:MAG: aldo/keto reductase [Mariniphaga sp.]|nr:aldo/keto reductase [Mariniphaga sp.]MDD4226883.1 aldo/keto reductase [Mariniphaga sp.]